MIRSALGALFALTLAVAVTAPAAHAGEKKMMHCFAFTPIKEATPAQWDAFFKATDAIPSKIPGISHVWYGKLRQPLGRGDTARGWGVCMEMDGPGTLTSYTANAYHDEWFAAYEKVRVEGTTTYDILGQ